MTQHFAFLASPWATPQIKEVRHGIWQLGRSRGLPVWVAEYSHPELTPGQTLTPLHIVDQCLRAIRDSSLFIFITDGSFGSYLNYADAALSSSYIEMELFQAAVLEKPVHVLVVGDVAPGTPLERLLHILEFAFPRSTRQQLSNMTNVIPAVDRILTFERLRPRVLALAPKVRRLVGALANERHQDWANQRLGREITLLDHVFDVQVSRPDPDIINSLLDEADNASGSQRKLTRIWLGIRNLMGASYLSTTEPLYLNLWDRALSLWATNAAWYGLHAHLFLGHQAALGSLQIVREKLRAKGVSTEHSGHTATVEGALASCFYSLSKIAPREQAESFLGRAALYVDCGLHVGRPIHHSGLHAIRGSIWLRRKQPQRALRAYEHALRLGEKANASEARKGELLAELGWAEVLAGNRQRGLAHLREGLALMKQHHGPGFIVRGQRKLAYGLLKDLQVGQALQEMALAHEMVEEYQLEDQEDMGMRMASRAASVLAYVGIDIKSWT